MTHTHTKYDQKDLLVWAYSCIENGSHTLSKLLLTVMILWGTDEAENLWVAKIISAKPLHIIPEN